MGHNNSKWLPLNNTCIAILGQWCMRIPLQESMSFEGYIMSRAKHRSAVRFRKLRSTLQKKFGESAIEMDAYATPSVTGHLEVTVNGKLIHSKKGGDGYVDNDAKLQKIIKAIEADL